LFGEEDMRALEAVLPDYIRGRRWFGGKARNLTSVDVLEAMPLYHATSRAYIVLVQVNYSEGDPQKYVLPLAYAEGTTVQAPEGAIVAHLGTGSGDKAGMLTVYDATFDPDFTLGLLDAIKAQKRYRSDNGEIIAWQTQRFTDQASDLHHSLVPVVMGADQSNTSIRYGDSFILKLFRRLEEGTSPELEFGRFFTNQGFAHTPPLAGAIEYKGPGPEPLTLATLQGFVRNQGDAWNFTLRSLMGFFKDAAREPMDETLLTHEARHPLDLAGAAVPPALERLAGGYFGSARLLGRRTAEMHIALGDAAGDPTFEPEPFTSQYQHDIYEAMRSLASHAFDMLKKKLDDLPDPARRRAEALLGSQDGVAARFAPIRERAINALRIRCHGDYHLGQVLYTGDDFMIIDFEGEPARSLSERRRKHSPLKDVAGMLRSFNYASYSGMFDHIARSKVKDSNTLDRLDAWGAAWQSWVSAAFLDAYLSTAQDSNILPPDRADLRNLLDAHLLEKAVYELEYELNNRPNWVRIPLSGIAQLAHP
jgi:maltose alpha-D-glucosyltransferase/alpha-amylase